MGIGIASAIAASFLYNLSVVLQKREAERTEAGGVRIVAALAHRPWWLAGVAFLLSGFACHAFALTRAPVAVVQSIIAAGVVFLVLLAAVVLHERPGRRELTGSAIAVTGTILLVATTNAPAALAPVPVPVLGITLAAVGLVIFLCARYGLRRSRAMAASAAVLMGIAIGFSNGTSDSMNRLMGAWLAPGDGWMPPDRVGIAVIVLLVAFGAVGFVLSQHAFRRYRANVLVPTALVAQLVVPIAIATFVYRQAVPRGVAEALARGAALLVIAVGVAILGRSATVSVSLE